MTEEFIKNFKPASGKIVVETPLFLLHMPDKVLGKFKEHVNSFNGDTATMEDDDYDIKTTSVCCLTRT